MPYRPMAIYEAGGFSFYFAYDSPTALHIERREGIGPQVAIDAFFEGWHSWNELRARFECRT